VFPRFSRMLACLAAAIAISGTTAPRADAGATSTGVPCPEILFFDLEHHDGGRPAEVVCSNDGHDGTLLTSQGGWTVPLPPVGMQVTQTAVTTSGHTEFIVRQTADHGVEAVFVDTADGPADEEPHADLLEDAAPGPYQGGAPNRCADDRWSSMGHWVYGPMVWSYNGAGAPAGVSAASQDAFTTGYDNVATAKDGCNLEITTVENSQVFAGPTTAAPGISAARTCTTYDGLNVAGWVGGGTGYLGLACIWSYLEAGYGARVYDADIVLNTNYAWSTGPDFSGSQYDVTSVVAHEAGHVFGLGHAGSSSSPSQLTMSGSGVYPASIYARLLGSGDVRGLTSLYYSVPLDR
jgi:hypothetical protein